MQRLEFIGGGESIPSLAQLKAWQPWLSYLQLLTQQKGGPSKLTSVVGKLQDW